ncbi:hypothetical protein [Amycolatopsis pithecellobii]|uniref:Uncharacterized protein n=1 Tax=Amycolatopsis pithecellobii TaxID=664692 RepID=A0A6N7Z3A6_9PSEU|nr:hypothetical protein [Amycolatopsis pithecellobii]MTD53366.1 hypothetical protein [Amycolatopsis pithecellobii]
MSGPTVLFGRKLAMLRAVADGRAEGIVSTEPDLYVDGLPCSDQPSAHELAHAGLIATSRSGLPGDRVPVEITRAGLAALGRTGRSA